MRAAENERRDWAVIAFILLLGLLWILAAGGWALRFSPSWELDTNVESRLDPNSDFLTRRPSGFIEPVDPAILTHPVWMTAFLTPGSGGAAFNGTQVPITAGTAITTPTVGMSATAQTISPTPLPTNTLLVLVSPTNTSVYYPPAPSSTSTSNPVPTAVVASPTPTATSPSASTFTPTSTATSTATATPTASATISPTSTATATATATSADTATATFTPTATATSTNTPAVTPTSTSPSFCTTTITITGTSGSYAKPAGSTCFEYVDTFANGGIFQITSTGVNGTVDGSACPGKSISSGATEVYGVAQSSGLMLFRITGTAGTVDINISDWTTYPSCP